eukprot:SAG31_NODE_28253_length_413_cov_0.659236_2_plen_34_part_01
MRGTHLRVKDLGPGRGPGQSIHDPYYSYPGCLGD